MERSVKLLVTLLVLLSGFAAVPSLARPCGGGSGSGSGIEQVQLHGDNPSEPLGAMAVAVPIAVARLRADRERGPTWMTPPVRAVSVEEGDRALE